MRRSSPPRGSGSPDKPRTSPASSINSTNSLLPWSDERANLRRREQEVAREKGRLEVEGMKEQRQQVREMEKKLESLLRDFEYQAREAVNAVQERAAAQKVSKDAERRISRLRHEFKEQFDSTVVAHRSGADRGDPNARPSEVKHVAEGDTVRLKSLGREAVVKRKVDENTFEVEAGIMKMRVPRDDIASVAKPAVEKAITPVAAARARGISVSLNSEDDLNVPTEINVIGQNVDDATREVEKFVDRAFLAGCRECESSTAAAWGFCAKRCDNS